MSFTIRFTKKGFDWILHLTKNLLFCELVPWEYLHYSFSWIEELPWLGIQSPYGKVLFEGEKQQLADTRAR
jgi:hypothetical protein